MQSKIASEVQPFPDEKAFCKIRANMRKVLHHYPEYERNMVSNEFPSDLHFVIKIKLYIIK